METLGCSKPSSRSWKPWVESRMWILLLAFVTDVFHRNCFEFVRFESTRAHSILKTQPVLKTSNSCLIGPQEGLPDRVVRVQVPDLSERRALKVWSGDTSLADERLGRRFRTDAQFIIIVNLKIMLSHFGVVSKLSQSCLNLIASSGSMLHGTDTGSGPTLEFRR